MSFKDNESQICPLCGKPNPLVRSHIIPKFMFKDMKAKEGRFYRMSDNPAKKVRILQDGPKENLLCATCDNERLQPYESYLHNFLYGGARTELARIGNDLSIRKIDYPRLKIALLSILWRMSKAKHEYFNAVSLGVKHEGALRDMIWNFKAGCTLHYPIHVAAPVFEEQHLGDWTLAPDKIRIENKHTVYRALIGGLLFCFWITSAPIPKEHKQIFLQDTGEVLIRRKKVEDIPFLLHACLELGKAQAIREDAD